MLTSRFPDAEVVEHWSNSWKLKLKRDSQTTIGSMFGLVEDHKDQYMLSEYSVSQTTLEQIFNHFASSAELKE